MNLPPVLCTCRNTKYLVVSTKISVPDGSPGRPARSGCAAPAQQERVLLEGLVPRPVVDDLEIVREHVPDPCRRMVGRAGVRPVVARVARHHDQAPLAETRAVVLAEVA